VCRTTTSSDASSSGSARPSPSTYETPPPSSRAGEQHRRRVDADRLRDAGPRGEVARDGTGAAADLGHARRVERELAEVGVAQLSRCLRVSRAQLQDVGELLDDGRIGLRDRRVDVGHVRLRRSP
jgi:hypothetical protein